MVQEDIGQIAPQNLAAFDRLMAEQRRRREQAGVAQTNQEAEIGQVAPENLEAFSRVSERTRRPVRNALAPDQVRKLLALPEAEGGIKLQEAEIFLRNFYKLQGMSSSQAARSAAQDLARFQGVALPPTPGALPGPTGTVGAGAGIPGTGGVGDIGEAFPDATGAVGVDPFIGQESRIQDVFRRFNIENLGFNQVSPLIQRGLSAQLPNIVSRFAVSQLGAPAGTPFDPSETPFFDFLGGGIDRESLLGGLGRLEQGFGGNFEGLLPGRAGAARDFFDPTSTEGRNRIVGSAIQPAFQGLSPIFRSSLRSGAANALQSALATDPELNPFTFFRERGFF